MQIYIGRNEFTLIEFNSWKNIMLVSSRGKIYNNARDVPVMAPCVSLNWDVYVSRYINCIYRSTNRVVWTLMSKHIYARRYNLSLIDTPAISCLSVPQHILRCNVTHLEKTLYVKLIIIVIFAIIYRNPRWYATHSPILSLHAEIPIILLYTPTHCAARGKGAWVT